MIAGTPAVTSVVLSQQAAACAANWQAGFRFVVSHGGVTCEHPTVRPVSVSDRTFTVRVRIAHGASVGPVVMRFVSLSDTRLEFAYGPHTLWLYDVMTPNGAEVLQVSTNTGRVENVVHMPKLYRPSLAADDDGLWLAVATNGDYSDEARQQAPIYRVALGAKAPTLVHRGGRAALWLVAAGHTVWADVLTGMRGAKLWRFDEPEGKAHALAPAGELNTWAAAAAPDGSAVWAVRQVPVGGKYYSCTAERVFRIDAHTGRQSLVATVPIPDQTCGDVSTATFTGRTFSFVLDSRLYRVAP
ncbi:MAG TPA: hypothetical protein VGL76_07865 [Gaiellaceae bacterium]